jgi:hypothetical protein
MKQDVESMTNGIRRDLIRRWEEPREFEPAHAYFSFIAGLNQQTSARVFANEMGFDGREMRPDECLSAVRHLPITGMARLIYATPHVTTNQVQLMGVNFRRAHWTGERPRVCPGCLAESPHFRTFHGLTSFSTCPFHGLDLISSAREDDPLGWLHPHLHISPKGFCLATPTLRLDPVPETFERWLLGRLNVIEPVSVPFLDSGHVADAIDSIDLVGRLVLGGWRRFAPHTGDEGFGRREVNNAGFKAFLGGAPSLEAIILGLAGQSKGRTARSGGKSGMVHALGWFYTPLAGSNPPAAIAAVRQVALSVAKRSGCWAARQLGIGRNLIHRLAPRLGIAPTRDNRFLSYEVAEVEAIKAALAEALQRNDAAQLCGVSLSEFDEIVRTRLIVPLCRSGGQTKDHDRFRLSDLRKLLPDVSEYVETDDSRFIAFRALVHDSGLTPAVLLQQIAFGDLQPAARHPDRTDLGGYLFDRDDVRHLTCRKSSETAIKTVKRRKLPVRQGMTCVDAAARFGASMSVIQALTDCDLLHLIDPLASGTKRPRIEVKSLERLCRLYAPPTAYADILGCQPCCAVKTLRAFGVPIKAFPRRDGLPAHIVLRSAVTKTMALFADPLNDGAPGWARFWCALCNYLMERKSVFRLTSVRNRPETFLRSGDRRTSVNIRIEESGRIVATMKVQSLTFKDPSILEFAPQRPLASSGTTDAEIVAAFDKLDHRNPAEYANCLEWIERIACQFQAIRERNRRPS